MAQPTAVRALAPTAPATEIRELLYKVDHPRPIDHYIDFFGDGVLSDDDADRCGELFLESLA